MGTWASCKRWWQSLDAEHSEHIEQLARTRWAVVLASAAALYIEMVMVRWHATCFHAFAIFKNVSLLSCFLGLGIGFALSGRQRVALGRFLPLLTLQTVLFGILSCTNLGGRIINPVSEQLIMGKLAGAWSLRHAIEGNLFLLVVFTINAWMFIPLGHLAGRLMSGLPRAEAYSLNLVGSLLGIGGFFVLSLVWAGPEIWLGLAVLLIAPFLAGDRRSVALAAGCAALMLVALGVISSSRGLTYYSPYQVITYQLPNPDQGQTEASVRVNHCYYQTILDCSPAAAAAGANPRGVLFYGLPYRLKKNPGDVLVVGAGTGNDVAAGLRHGARSVTAVELDPAILALGRRVHPERPYADPRTRIVVNDARTFIRQTDQRFDTIVYGLLDSHTNLGAMTNVRVDSFVYTVEAFRESVRRLSDDGMVIVSYTLLDRLQGRKLYGMLNAAYPDAPPRVFCVPGGNHDSGTTFVTGPGLASLPSVIPGVRELTSEYAKGVHSWELATDNWPFFYMKKRTYPFSYLLMIGMMLVVSGWLIRAPPRLLISASTPPPSPPSPKRRGGRGRSFSPSPLRGGGRGEGFFASSPSPLRGGGPGGRGFFAFSPSPLRGGGRGEGFFGGRGSGWASWGLFFFLGAGFMLIEAKGVTELGLIFGNTWAVVAVVITGILLMSYLANRWVMFAGSVHTRLAFALLMSSLVIGWAVSSLSLTGAAVPLPWLVLPAVLTLPLLFAGLIFSSALTRVSDIGSALSANILGAMLGGFLEYNSMYWGYTSLYPLGLVLYGLAFVCSCLAGATETQVDTTRMESPLNALMRFWRSGFSTAPAVPPAPSVEEVEEAQDLVSSPERTR